jgi:hypothetical protein
MNVVTDKNHSATLAFHKQSFEAFAMKTLIPNRYHFINQKTLEINS